MEPPRRGVREVVRDESVAMNRVPNTTADIFRMQFEQAEREASNRHAPSEPSVDAQNEEVLEM